MRAHLLKILTLLVVCGVVALVIVLSVSRSPEPPPPHQLPPAVVTLGDSTLSGEGGGAYEPGTNGENNNWCHRSAAAPLHQMNLPSSVARINLACSGAKAKLVGSEPSPEHVEGSQAQRLADIVQRYRVTDIVVQTGANDDPAFTEVVHQCAGAWASRSRGCAEQLREEWPRRVDRMEPKVVSALEDLRAVMERAGYARHDYSLVVQSYASPVGPNIAPGLQDLSGCPFLTEDAAWLRDTAVPQLSDGLREVAQRVGARYLDLSRAGRGHEACSGGATAPANEWFTRLTVDWNALQSEHRAPHAMQESFHPNSVGHAQFGHCLGQFLASRDRYSLCLPDNRGSLRAVPVELAQQRPSRAHR